MSNIEELLPHLSDDDRTNFMRAVGQIGAAFAARTTIEVDPQVIAALPQVRDHVLSDMELDLAAALAALEVYEQEDIAANIDDALRAADVRKRARIIELCPPRRRELFEQFAGLTGSVIQRSLHNGSICYKRFVLRRVKSPQERRFLSVSLVEAMDWNRTGTDKWR